MVSEMTVQLLRQLQRQDTATDVAARLRRNAALEGLRVEMALRFPQITPANASEAMAWQAQRLEEINQCSS